MKFISILETVTLSNSYALHIVFNFCFNNIMFNFSSSVLLAWCLSLLIIVDIDCKFYSNMYNFPTDINKPEYLLKNINKDVNLPILTTDSQTMINITQLSSNFMYDLISNNQVQIVYNSYNELDVNVMKTNISNIHNNITFILDISHNILKSNVIHIINQIIKKLNKLQVLILDYNHLHYHDVRNMISILRRHPSIQQLSLSSCSLTDECMGCIAYLLKMNSNITSLDLSNNRITEIGFSEILYVLQHHSSNLAYLDLSYNKIGNHGISLLINLLENNKLPQLKYLLLKDVGIDRECVEKLLSVLNLRAVCYYNAMGVNNINVSTPHIDSASNVSDFTDDALKKSKVIIAEGSIRSKMVKKRKGGGYRRSNNSSSSYNSKKGSRDKGLDNVNKATTVSSRLMVLDISGNLLFVRKTNRKKTKKLPDFLTMPSLPTLFTSILNTYGSSSSSNGVTSSDDDDDVNANANANDEESRDTYNAIDETISTTATNIRYGRSCNMKTIKSNRSLKIQKINKNKSGTSGKKKMKFITKYTRKTVTDNANVKKDKHMENRKYLKKKKIMKINQSQVSSVYNSLNKSILELMMMMMMMPGTVNSVDSSFYLGLVETGLNDVWCSELIEMIEKEKKIRKLGQNRNGNNSSSGSNSCINIDDDDDDDSAKVFKTGLSFNIIGNDISAVLLTKLLQL